MLLCSILNRKCFLFRESVGGDGFLVSVVYEQQRGEFHYLACMLCLIQVKHALETRRYGRLNSGECWY